MKTSCLIVFLLITGFAGYSQKTHDSTQWFEKADSIYKENEMLNSELSLTVNGHISDNKKYCDIKNDLKIDYGYYPFEIDFSLKVETLLEENKLNERINEIDISFDNHPMKIGNGRNLETYIFASRFSDEYLNIDRKYEMGGGVIFNFWSPNRLTDNGIKAKKLYSDESINKNSTFKEIIDTLKNRGIPEDKAKTVFNTYQYSIKKYSKWRIALLMGIFYELEHISPSDTIIKSPEDFFDVSNQIKGSIRPTIVFHPDDQFTIKADFYCKVPLDKIYDDYFNEVTVSERKFNCFIDCPVTMSYKVNKKISISFVYRLFYDNIPRQKIFNYNGQDMLISANKTHHYFDSKLCFNF